MGEEYTQVPAFQSVFLGKANRKSRSIEVVP
jgi:hypothetical protein